MTKTNLGRKGFISAYSSNHNPLGRKIRAGNQDRKPSTGKLAAYYWFTHSFSCRTQDHEPRGGTAHSGLGPPTVVIDQENAPGAHPQVGLMEALEFPLPR